VRGRRCVIDEFLQRVFRRAVAFAKEDGEFGIDAEAGGVGHRPRTMDVEP